MPISSIDFFEINEAFSLVPIVNARLLEIGMEKVNVNGGAVAMGHPLGMSGARILLNMVWILHARQKRLGLVCICNGGGGATAMIIEAVG